MQASNHPIISTRTALRPTILKIDLEQISRNFAAIQDHVGRSIVMPIIKANAYGHGLVRVGQHMQKNGATMLGIALLEEGILLREAGVTLPILVLGGILGSQIPLFLEHDLTLTASSEVKLEQIEAAAQLAEIDDQTFSAVQRVLFDLDDVRHRNPPTVDTAIAGVLLEIVKQHRVVVDW